MLSTNDEHFFRKVEIEGRIHSLRERVWKAQYVSNILNKFSQNTTLAEDCVSREARKNKFNLAFT